MGRDGCTLNSPNLNKVSCRFCDRPRHSCAWCYMVSERILASQLPKFLLCFHTSYTHTPIVWVMELFHYCIFCGRSDTPSGMLSHVVCFYFYGNYLLIIISPSKIMFVIPHTSDIVDPGGPVVILATGSKVCRFKPGRGQWIFSECKKS